MAAKQKYETRPLECWEKAKELRREFDQGRVDAAKYGHDDHVI